MDFARYRERHWAAAQRPALGHTMKDCWAVLGIPRMRDPAAVKKAYRDLIKRYHPDTVNSPERVRHYTIKCAELNAAREQAIAYCGGGPEPAARANHAPSPTQRPEETPYANARGSRMTLRGAVALAVFLASPWLLINLVGWMTSLPYDNPVRMILSGLLAIPVAMAISGGISVFIMLPVGYIAFVLEETPLARYTFKAAWVVGTVGQFLVVYYGGYHFPFEHMSTQYYAFLYQTTRLTAWIYVPAACLGFWAKEYYKYLKVRRWASTGLATIE
jgi:hypothetical protein